MAGVSSNSHTSSESIAPKEGVPELHDRHLTNGAGPVLVSVPPLVPEPVPELKLLPVPRPVAQPVPQAVPRLVVPKPLLLTTCPRTLSFQKFGAIMHRQNAWWHRAARLEWALTAVECELRWVLESKVPRDTPGPDRGAGPYGEAPGIGIGDGDAQLHWQLQCPTRLDQMVERLKDFGPVIMVATRVLREFREGMSSGDSCAQ